MTAMSVNCCQPALGFGLKKYEHPYPVKKSAAHRAAERSGGRQTPAQANVILSKRREAYKNTK